jgi:hypothetical protein
LTAAPLAHQTSDTQGFGEIASRNKAPEAAGYSIYGMFNENPLGRFSSSMRRLPVLQLAPAPKHF